jgi:hypothetical protein
MKEILSVNPAEEYELSFRCVATDPELGTVRCIGAFLYSLFISDLNDDSYREIQSRMLSGMSK